MEKSNSRFKYLTSDELVQQNLSGGLFTYTHTLKDSSSFYQADCPPVSLSSIHTVFLLKDNISGQKKKKNNCENKKLRLKD